MSEQETAEFRFAKGKAVAGEALEELKSWRYPDITVDENAIFRNAYNHKFRLMQDLMDSVDDELELPTIEEIEAIRKSAYDEGLEQGKHEGREQGKEEGRKEGLVLGEKQGFEQGNKDGYQAGLNQGNEQVQRFSDLANQLQHPLDNLDKNIEQQMLDLITHLAKGVIMHELKQHPEQILAAIRLAVNGLPQKNQDITIHLNPEDVDLVEQFYNGTQLAERQWTLNADTSLNRGELNVDTHYSHVDFSLDKRIETIFHEVDSMKEMPPAMYEHPEPETDIQDVVDDETNMVDADALEQEPVEAQSQENISEQMEPSSQQSATSQEADVQPNAPEETESSLASANVNDEQRPSETLETPSGDDTANQPEPSNERSSMNDSTEDDHEPQEPKPEA